MDNLQSKTSHEEHNWINILAKPTELADLRMKTKEGHLQSGPSMNIEAQQDQEGSKESLPTAARHNRSLDQSPQVAEQTEQQAVFQPTL